MPPPMTTTLAKLFGPSALFVVALLGMSCGGESVREEAGESGAPSQSTAPGDNPGSGSDTPALGNSNDDPGPAAGDGARCERVCSGCLSDQLGLSCGDFCTDIYDNARQAGCTSALTSLLRCRDGGKGCGATDCATENNALTACVIGYCDGHYAPLCSAPL
jgi:hypothetical protein